jgi:hypothetical protein
MDDVAGLLAQWKLELAVAPKEVEEVALLDQWRRDAAGTADRVDAEVREVFGDAALARRLARRVAERWVELVRGDVREARAWWAAGINPLDQSVAELIEEHVRPEDLAIRVDGRSLLEHFRSGEYDKSGRWCARQASLRRSRPA